LDFGFFFDRSTVRARSCFDLIVFFGRARALLYRSTFFFFFGDYNAFFSPFEIAFFFLILFDAVGRGRDRATYGREKSRARRRLRGADGCADRAARFHGESSICMHGGELSLAASFDH
jgi:hypothetical protein